jgi:hypothetical protein
MKSGFNGDASQYTSGKKMSAFPDWQGCIVKQKRRETGCIPTGYEMILRAAGINHVTFDTFQDEFDLDKNLKPGIRLEITSSPLPTLSKRNILTFCFSTSVSQRAMAGKNSRSLNA